jgi:Glutamine amidotransferase domain
MCGIFGYVGRASNRGKINTLMLVNDQRGGDSTGMYVIKAAPSLGKDLLGKRPVNALGFLKAYKVPFWEDSVLAIGHVRSATVGLKTEANAHPFEVLREDKTKLVGAHNGTLTNHHAVNAAEAFTPLPTVDSDTLFRVLAKYGPEGLSKLTGSMAIAYWEKRDNTLNLYRRTERPLFWGRDEEGGVYYSSMSEGLVAIDCRDIVSLDADTLISFNIDTLQASEPVKLELPVVVPVALPPAYNSNYSHNYGRRWDKEDDWGMATSEVNKAPLVRPKVTKTSPYGPAIIRDAYNVEVNPYLGLQIQETQHRLLRVMAEALMYIVSARQKAIDAINMGSLIGEENLIDNLRVEEEAKVVMAARIACEQLRYLTTGTGSPVTHTASDNWTVYDLYRHIFRGESHMSNKAIENHNYDLDTDGLTEDIKSLFMIHDEWRASNPATQSKFDYAN